MDSEGMESIFSRLVSLLYKMYLLNKGARGTFMLESQKGKGCWQGIDL
jgi:hypothetical protein